MLKEKLPEDLLVKARYFSDPIRCERIIMKARWPGGKPVCPKCGSTNIVKITTRKSLRCKDCRLQFSMRIGTLFEDSPLSLGQWFSCFYAVYTYPKITFYMLSILMDTSVKTAWNCRQKFNMAVSLIGPSNTFEDILNKVIQLPKSEIESRLNLKFKRKKPILKFNR
jgi:transposase-like protein